MRRRTLPEGASRFGPRAALHEDARRLAEDWDDWAARAEPLAPGYPVGRVGGGCDRGVMVWDEALAEGYDVWSARMTEGLELESVYGDFTGRPLTDDSSEYVFIAYRNTDKT